VLGFGVGGVTGPAIRPIAVRCVFDLYKSIKIPIIGTGGVMNGRDAIEMLQAGASAIGIGTGVHFRGPGVFRATADEMKWWMRKHKFKSIKELFGIAHK